MTVFYPHPTLNIHLVSAKDSTFTDDQNQTYLDFESGIWCANIGHSPDQLVPIYSNQSRKLIHHHTLFKNSAVEKLSEKLLLISSFDKGASLFLSSGSEAVLFAITIAKLIHPSASCVSFEHSYLGAYPSMISDDTSHIQISFKHCPPNCENRADLNCHECNHLPISIKQINKPFIFILELGTQEKKLLFPPQKLVRYISHRVHENKGLIICNEITSGIGRTSEWFAFKHYDIAPHIIALGKGLGNGYPISAILMNQQVQCHENLKTFRYVQSHQNDPLGAEIACTVVDTIIENNLIVKSKDISKYFVDALDQLVSSEDSLVEVRGKGLMLGLICDQTETATALFSFLLNHHIFVGCQASHALIRFFPPMTIQRSEIDSLIYHIKLFFTTHPSSL